MSGSQLAFVRKLVCEENAASNECWTLDGARLRLYRREDITGKLYHYLAQYQVLGVTKQRWFRSHSSYISWQKGTCEIDVTNTWFDLPRKVMLDDVRSKEHQGPRWYYEVARPLVSSKEDSSAVSDLRYNAVDTYLPKEIVHNWIQETSISDHRAAQGAIDVRIPVLFNALSCR